MKKPSLNQFSSEVKAKATEYLISRYRSISERYPMFANEHNLDEYVKVNLPWTCRNCVSGYGHWAN